MSRKYQGIFLFGEWLTALRQLPPDVAMDIIAHIYEFDVHDTEPPTMEGGAELVQSIMLAHERRTKVSAAYGNKGASTRWKKTPVKETPAREASGETARPRTFADMSTEELMAYWNATADDPISEEDAEWDARRAMEYERVLSKRNATHRHP